MIDVDRPSTPHFVRYRRGDLFLERLADVWCRANPSGPIFSMQVRADHLNPLGTLHGGMMAALMDVVFVDVAHAVDAHRRTFTTVSLNLEFMAPGMCGDWLAARSQVERIGGALAFLSGRLLSEETPIMRANAVLKAVPHV